MASNRHRCGALSVRAKEIEGRISGIDDSVLAICAVFIAAFPGQAVLFRYTEPYVFPVKLLLLLGAEVTIETVARLVAISIRRPELRDALESW